MKTIDNYSFEEILGSGQYGKVYKARHQQTSEFFAIKSIKKALLQKFKLDGMVHNEVSTLKSISHPHIVKLIALKQTETHYYFIYEYCNGGTLETYMKNHSSLIPQLEVQKYIIQLLSAFQTLNSLSIAHRDVKPSNILFHNGNLKLADFGFCKTLSNPNEMMETMVGSPLFMAPEILKGKPYNKKADIWSFGVVIYQMLYGRVPFEEKSLILLIQKLETEELIIDSTKGFEGVLRRMLEKDPMKRIDWEGLAVEFNLKESTVSKENERINEHAFGIVYLERAKVQFLYQVLGEMLALRLSNEPLVYYLMMKRIYWFAKGLIDNLVKKYKREKFWYLQIDEERMNAIAGDDRFKHWAEIIKEEFISIENNYERFLNEIQNCGYYEGKTEECDEKRFYNKIFEYCGILKDKAEGLKNKDKEKDLYFHLNQVLESINLHEFVQNYFEIGKNLKNQKYFEILKCYDRESLKNIALNKLALYSSKFLENNKN